MHQQPHTGGLDHSRLLVQGEAWVERDACHAGLEAREVDRYGPQPVVDQQPDPRTPLHPESAEHVGQPVRRAVHLGEGHRLRSGDHGCAPTVPGSTPAYQFHGQHQHLPPDRARTYLPRQGSEGIVERPEQSPIRVNMRIPETRPKRLVRRRGPITPAQRTAFPSGRTERHRHPAGNHQMDKNTGHGPDEGRQGRRDRSTARRAATSRRPDTEALVSVGGHNRDVTTGRIPRMGRLTVLRPPASPERTARRQSPRESSGQSRSRWTSRSSGTVAPFQARLPRRPQPQCVISGESIAPPPTPSNIRTPAPNTTDARTPGNVAAISGRIGQRRSKQQ